jgi:hypothetical protein
MTNEQQHAVDAVLALRALTRETGTKTTRTVNNILQKLSDEDLTIVAQVLREASIAGGAR